MDIAFINRMLGLTRGGGELWDLQIAEALRGYDVDVTFYVGSPLLSDVDVSVEGYETVPVPTPHLRDFAYAAPRGIGGMLEEIDAASFARRSVRRLVDTDHDIVHVNSDPRYARYIDELDVPVTIKMNGPPHSFLYDTLIPWRSSYDYFSAFDAVIATGVTVDRIRAETDVAVSRINPGVDTTAFSPAEQTTRDSSGPFTVLFVGRFVPVKNIPFLVSSFAAFHESHPDSRLVLVGDGPKRRAVETAVENHGIGDAVRLPGYVPNDELPELYRDADVFVLSSDHESFGMVLLEAMSSGLPVVAPAIDWIPAIVEDETDGLLYEPGSQSELLDHLETLYADEQRRRRLGQQARESIEAGYDWDSRASDLKAVFETVLRRHSQE